MPSELGHHRRQRLRGGERHAAAIMQLPVAEEMIEAQRAHAEIIPAPQGFGRDRFIGHRDAAQTIRLARQRIQHRRIVAAMRAALHQHAAIETDRVEHAEIFCQRRIRRRVAAIVGVRKPRRRPEHMRVGIAGIRRRRHFRPARLQRRQAGGNHRMSAASFGLHARGLDDRAPFLVVGVDHRIEFLRRTADRRRAESIEPALTAGAFSAATKSLENCATTWAGMPAGPTSPHHTPVS